MSDTDQTIPKEEMQAVEADEFQLTFKNGALLNLKSLASELNISQENLAEVVNKSIHLLSIVQRANTKQIVLESKDNRKYFIDPGNL